mgnify:FL=1
MDKDTLLIDGHCGLCTRAGKFISKRQVRELKITELESELGLDIVERYNIKIDSMVLIRKDKAYIQSSAAIRCLLYMGLNWRVLYPFAWIIPSPVRDLFYKLISTHRK